jgi:hypothetical protein
MRGGEIASCRKFRRLGPRKSRQELFKLANDEVPRERDRESSASRLIGSRGFENPKDR